MSFKRLSWAVFRSCAGIAGSFLLWSLWLALAGLAATLATIAATNQLAVPPFILRSIEEDLAVSGIQATFGRTRFDPTGRILIEDLSLKLPGFEEPVATAKAAYVRLDPWALALRRVEPREFWITGMSLKVPAMLSPSGRTEEMVGDLDATLRPEGDLLEIEHATGWVGTLPVSVRGSLRLDAASGPPASSPPVAEYLARHYASIARRASEAAIRLQAFDHPFVSVALMPAQGGMALARVTVVADSLDWEHKLLLSKPRLEGRFQLGADAPQTALDLLVSCESARWQGVGEVRAAKARVEAMLGSDPLSIRPTWIIAAASEATAAGFRAGVPLVSIVPEPWPKLKVEARALLPDQPVTVSASVDAAEGAVRATVKGRLSPALVGPVSSRLGRDLSTFLELRKPVAFDGEVSAGPKWQLQSASGNILAGPIRVGRVWLAAGGGRIEWRGGRIWAPEAFAQTATSLARGSFLCELPSKRFRFLLEGHLQPSEIDGWFPEWWRDLFSNFGFPSGPALGNVDVQGRFGTARDTTAFVWADASPAIVRGAPFDHALVRMFTRWQFTDALEMRVEKAGRSASAWFVRRGDTERGGFRQLDFGGESNLDLKPAPTMLGQEGPFGAFVFERPPQVGVRGRIYGAGQGRKSDLDVSVASDGPLKLYGYPLEGATAHATVADDRISVDKIQAAVAGGQATGSVVISGAPAGRSLSFDLAVRNANLGPAVASFQEFTRTRAAAPTAAPAQNGISKYLDERAQIHLDLDVAAMGKIGDLDSFKGTGKAAMHGAELKEIRLLGALSRVLKFTSLRFTDGAAEFQIESGKILFSKFDLTGANSVIRASGSYAIDQHKLDFRAKIFPFENSSSIPQRLLNIPFAPITTLLEMRLSGNIDDPTWAPGIGLGERAGDAPAPAQSPGPGRK